MNKTNCCSWFVDSLRDGLLGVGHTKTASISTLSFAFASTACDSEFSATNSLILNRLLLMAGHSKVTSRQMAHLDDHVIQRKI